MKRFLTNGIMGILCFTIYGFTALPAQALPLALLGGAAHLLHFGGAASGVLHASKAIGATSYLSKSMTYSKGITATRTASSNLYRTSALSATYSPYPMMTNSGFHTPGISEINSVPQISHQALPAAAPLPSRALAPPGPYDHWDRWDRDAAWFVGGVFVGAAVTPLFLEQPVYYYPAYPGYYVVPACPPTDSSSCNTEPKKVEPTANTD